MKKGFKCFLCDFDNAPYFDEENKFVNFNNDLCLDMIDNTAEFFLFYNKIIYRYINSVNFLAHCSSF